MFWAEAVATEVRSVVTVMPVMRMPLTPRLKRVWRRAKKAKGSPESRTHDPPSAPLSLTFGGRRKYDLSVPGVRRLDRVRNASARATGRWMFRRIAIKLATILVSGHIFFRVQFARG